MGSCASDSGGREDYCLGSLCSYWQELGGSPEQLLLTRQDGITQGTEWWNHTSVQSSSFYRAKIAGNSLWCEAACSGVPIQTQQELGAAPVRSHPDKSVRQDWLESRMVRFLSEPWDFCQSVVAEKQVLGLLLKGKKLGKILLLLGQSKSFGKSHTEQLPSPSTSQAFGFEMAGQQLHW